MAAAICGQSVTVIGHWVWARGQSVGDCGKNVGLHVVAVVAHWVTTWEQLVCKPEHCVAAEI